MKIRVMPRDEAHGFLRKAFPTNDMYGAPVMRPMVSSGQFPYGWFVWRSKIRPMFYVYSHIYGSPDTSQGGDCWVVSRI